jgi:hypothetical protein
MNKNGKSSSTSCVDGERRVRGGNELPVRSMRKKNFTELLPKPHDAKGRLVR